MPDTNVLQLATLIVLLLVLLVLVILAQTMSRIEKSFGRGTETEPAETKAAEPEEEEAQAEPVTTKKKTPRRSFRRSKKQDDQPGLDVAPIEAGAGGAAAAGAAAAAAQTEPASQAQPDAASQPAAQSEAAPAVQQQPAAERSVHPLETAAAEEQAARAAQGSQSLDDLPQEEPFERDGRWWFVRGNELLVYDESTGQWTPGDQRALGVASSSEAPAPSTSDRGATSQIPVAGGYQQDRAAQGDAPAGEAQGGFWKCPSCGAVNGSTSPTCRMCFTPRP